MKKVFLKKYQDYYKGRELEEEIFEIMQKEYESLNTMWSDFSITFKDQNKAS
jgi:hypothetical protein